MNEILRKALASNADQRPAMIASTHACASGIISAMLLAVVLLTLLPCPIIWYGLTVVHNTIATLALYHTICLLPAVIWGIPLWRRDLVLPTKRQLALLVVASALFSSGAVMLYHFAGDYLLDSRATLNLLTGLGLCKQNFLLTSIYFIIANSFLEELFWRGVVLNLLDKIQTSRYLAIAWSSISYGLFHYFIMRLVLYPGWSEIGAILLMLYGAALSIIYRKTRSIIFTAFSHALLTDLAAIVLIVVCVNRCGMASCIF